MAAEQGVIGLLAYLALLVLALRARSSAARGGVPVRAAVAAAFVALVAHSLMYAAFLEDPLTWTLLGAGTAMALWARRRASPRRHEARARPSRRRAGCRWRWSSPLLLVPTYPNYDTYFHLVWGRGLCAARSPTSRPTPRRPSTRCSWPVRAGRAARRPTATALIVPDLRAEPRGLAWGSFRLGDACFGLWPALAGGRLSSARASRSCSTPRAPTSTSPSSRWWCGRRRWRHRRPARGVTVMSLLALAGPAAWPTTPPGGGVRVALGGRMFQEPGGLGPAELIGILAAIVILLVAFGSLLAMGLPILIALFGIGIGLGFVELLSHVIATPDFATQLASMIGIGVGIDYALVHRHPLPPGPRARASSPSTRSCAPSTPRAAPSCSPAARW